LAPTNGQYLVHATIHPEQSERISDDRVRVLVVDDHVDFRAALRDLVAAVPRFVLVGQAGSGEEALEAVDRLAPQFVLMDIMLPGMSGIAAGQAILTAHPGTVVVLISINDPAGYVEAEDLCPPIGCARKQDLRPESLDQMWETLHT